MFAPARRGTVRVPPPARFQTFEDQPPDLRLKVDWTEPHREDVEAGVHSAVKPVLAGGWGQARGSARPCHSSHAAAEELDRAWPLVA